MNYNEEMAKLFNKLGLEYKLEEIKDKASKQDYNNIENKLIIKDAQRTIYNEIPKESMPCLILKR